MMLITTLVVSFLVCCMLEVRCSYTGVVSRFQAQALVLEPAPPSRAVVKKEYSYTSTPPMGCMACIEPQCLYNGALYLYLYLYSSYGLYSWYRASVPVQWCSLPLPIPLLPLWAVRPVESLSACAMVHFTITFTPPMDCTACTEPQCLYNGALYLYLYLYSPYGPYSLYIASVPVQRCTLTLPIPLLPLWTVRPVQSLSACTTVHFNLTYTSTPPMDRTACTEPQCLYNGAL